MVGLLGYLDSHRSCSEVPIPEPRESLLYLIPFRPTVAPLSRLHFLWGQEGMRVGLKIGTSLNLYY
ncbi:unnamed protein product [Ilex paraguariensis]|uniref:Uncharacterized protein n=1 Tax=Ilex paraguariensis TaxID=185542 RepID=A0ABC8UM90_9AQUA